MKLDRQLLPRGWIAPAALLSAIGIGLQQISMPYVWAHGGVTDSATLMHLHTGLGLAIAMLFRDIRILVTYFLVLFCGWVVRAYVDNSTFDQIWPGIVDVLIIIVWSRFCAKLMGWPRDEGHRRIERADLPRFAFIGLMLFPLGVVFSGIMRAWVTVPEELFAGGLQVIFARFFGVLIVTVPLIGFVTEFNVREPYRLRVKRSPHRRALWLLLMLGLLVLAYFVLSNVDRKSTANGAALITDFRYAVAGVLAWVFLYLRPRLAFALLSVAMILICKLASMGIPQPIDPVALANLASISFEALILQIGLLFVFVYHRDVVTQARRLSTQAHVDPVSQLPNLVAFRDVAKLMQKRGEPLEIGYMFIDSSEEWTAGFGIDLQARVQREIAQQLSNFCEPFIAGTGQFVLMPRAEGLTERSWVRVIRRIESLTVDIDGQLVRLSPYLGVAVVKDDSVLALNSALLVASQLAFDARRRYEVRPLYDSSSEPLAGAARTRLQSVGEALANIRSRRIELWFQEIVPAGVRAHDGRRYGEILCRLRSADGELMQPTSFIEPLEAAGRGAELDLSVWRSLVSVLSENHDVASRLRLSVNLGGASLASASFLRDFERVLDAMPVPADSICLEITETAAISGLDEARAVLERVRARGCRIAIDDFGSGVQNFSRLRDLPVDVLKLDGSYVRNVVGNPKDQALVRAAVQLAQAFNAETVAEYVETEEAAQCLREIGVDWFQGHLFAEARPLNDVLEELRRYR
ncbi:EAL domain-containing protein [Lysobacter sp. HDW10]|uniref:EAL domain-containing protein n=1 Tax=Lysobacter sp. HDW10 TaxID=2714936 RepID=UPI00140B1C53|nr:GGDEF domain-containing phosphodiesterase [Lysobacter sp. HDW10]QIK80324.1 EAL domain-containing protein [Lysobacter sp. HDW10]